MDFKTLEIKKAKWWQEIKSLEQEYFRNLDQVKSIQERQSDISFEIQNRLDKINIESEKYDHHCFINKIGEFKETTNE